jgi:hypothetical protein
VLLVLVRQMRTRERSGSPLDDTLSQRELRHSGHTGTLQLHALLQSFSLAFSAQLHALLQSFSLAFSTTTEDVSPSQL